jgi:F0F1-type ATP synthase membrane subunit c/vacuolar-type H+-ATPase subunit K
MNPRADRLLGTADNKKHVPWSGVGIGVGLAQGAALGAAFHNVGLGIAMGLAFGAFYAGTARRKRPDT